MVDIRESEHKNKREFSRVDIRLPLEVRLVPPEQKRLMCNRLERVLTGTKLPPVVADPLLAEWLRLLNTKLDNILSTLATNEDVHELPPLRTESLSGGGASFTSTEEYQPGDLLELKIMFDSFLTGTLQGMSTRTKAGTSDYILYNFHLIDARTSAIVWEDMAEIKKQGLEDAAYR